MNKTPDAARMAGEQDDYLRVRIPNDLHVRLRAAVRNRTDKSKAIRNLIEAYCDAAEHGDSLIAPLVVRSKGKK